MMNLLQRFSLILAVLCLFSSVYAGSVQGIVIDEASRLPVVGAQITALGYSSDNADSLYFSTTTTEEGHYSLENIPPGVYNVWCEHPSYFRWQRGEIFIDNVTGFELNIELLQLNGSFNNYITGHVFSTPSMLPAFIPLAGANVYLRGNGLSLHEISDSRGYYAFRNITPGKYTISADAPRHEPAQNVATIEVSENTKITDLDINLKPYDHPGYVSLEGYVGDKSSNEPVHPAYITLIPLYYILSESPMPPDIETISVCNNPDGSFLIENIPSGTYDIMCTARGYHSVIKNHIDLAAQDMFLEFLLEPLDPALGNLVSGAVFDASTQRPIPMANVSMFNLDGPEDVVYHSYTDGSGYYQFYGLNPGNHELTIYKRGYYPLKDTIVVGQHTWLTDLDYYLKPIILGEPITLYGSVWEKNDQLKPVYPANINLYGANDATNLVVYRTQNNPDGSYKLSGIKPGVYRAECISEGYEKQVIHNLRLENPEHRLDFYLTPEYPPRWGYVSGKVYFDRTHKPVSGAYITFFSEKAIYHRAITNEHGEYKARLPEGIYFVSCLYITPDGSYHYQEFYNNVHSISDATPVYIRAGQATNNINFGIPYPAVVSSVIISGRVTDDDGLPLENALVKVHQVNPPHTQVRYEDGNIYSVWTNSDGYYKLGITYHWFTLPHHPLAFIVSAQKKGYKIEFYEEKPAHYLADILWAYTDTVFTDINFTLDPFNLPNSISGTITSEFGQPLANAVVIGVNATTGEIVSDFTNNFGEYHLGALKKDDYYLLFVANGYIPEYYDNVQEWEEATPVLADGIVTGIDARLMPIYFPVRYDSAIGLMITGKISDDSGKSLSGALITLQNTNGDVLAYAFSDSAGAYDIGLMGDGRYRLSVTRPNYQSEYIWIDFNSEISDLAIQNFTMSNTFTNIGGQDPTQEMLPKELELLPNYPNPFNPTTHIRFSIPKAQHIQLIIFDILGKKVRELVNRIMPSGRHTITWNGRDDSGRQVASGIYFYILETPSQRLTKKMILNR